MVSAGPVACWLWFCGVLYCRRALTDGFIPKGKVPGLIVGLSATNAFRQAAKLCEVELWHEEIGGYRVHDYLDWNPTKAAIENYRKRDRQRKHERHGIHADSEMESDRNPQPPANACAEHARTKSESESEQGFSDLVSEREENPTNEIPPVWRPPSDRRPIGLIDGAAQRRHQAHAWCGDREGLCVPAFLDLEFAGKSGKPEAELHAWYASVLVRYRGRSIGEDALTFWRNEFAAWIGQASSKPSGSRGKGERTVDAMTQAIARRHGGQS